MQIDNISLYKLLQMIKEVRLNMAMLGRAVLFVGRDTNDMRLHPAIEILTVSLTAMERVNELVIALLPIDKQEEVKQLLSMSTINKEINEDLEKLEDTNPTEPDIEQKKQTTIKDTKVPHLKLVTNEVASNQVDDLDILDD